MFCNQCGTENRNDRKFCASCGSALRDYTKPRENLIMPQDIEREQQLVNSRNKLAKIFNLVLSLILLVAVVLTVGTFFVPESWRLIVGISCVSLFAIFIVLWAVKKLKIRKIEKQLDTNENKE